MPRSEGIVASLTDCPGDVFDEQDEQYARCLIAIALSSFWDFIIVTSKATCDLFVSHDEFLHPVHLADKSLYKELRRHLK